MIKEYVTNICYYVIISTILFNVFPDEKHVRYVKLFSGFILILIIMTPIAHFFDIEVEFQNISRELSIDIGQENLENNIKEYESLIGERIKEMETLENSE